MGAAAAPSPAERAPASGTESSRSNHVAGTNALRPFQTITTNTPPLPPSQFNPDPGVPPVPGTVRVPDTILRLKWATNSSTPAQPPGLFNTHPGAVLKSPPANVPFFTNELGLPPAFRGPPVPQAVPRRRYNSGAIETPYETPEPMLWHPYTQSILKGDAPIIGQDVFLDLTAGSQTEFAARRLPTASGVSAAEPNSAEFFGRSEQLFVQNYFSFTADLFK